MPPGILALRGSAQRSRSGRLPSPPVIEPARGFSSRLITAQRYVFSGVTDGIRTRDIQGHNLTLCQLSYGHQPNLHT